MFDPMNEISAALSSVAPNLTVQPRADKRLNRKFAIPP